MNKFLFKCFNYIRFMFTFLNIILVFISYTTIFEKKIISKILAMIFVISSIFDFIIKFNKNTITLNQHFNTMKLVCSEILVRDDCMGA